MLYFALGSDGAEMMRFGMQGRCSLSCAAQLRRLAPIEHVVLVSVTDEQGQGRDFDGTPRAPYESGP